MMLAPIVRTRVSNSDDSIKPLFGLKHPASGALHSVGFVGAILGLVSLLSFPVPGKTWEYFVSSTVFCGGMALLYLSSSSYHLLTANQRITGILRRIDHSMIFLFIAGCITPFCLTASPAGVKFMLLGTIWVLAVAGVCSTALLARRSRWLRVGAYLVTGGLGALVLAQVSGTVSPQRFAWILAGCLAYVLGALVYALKWPNPFPKYFGFHEIWHVFVLLGSGCHFVAVKDHLISVFTTG